MKNSNILLFGLMAFFLLATLPSLVYAETTYDGPFDTKPTVINASNLEFSPDGTKMYVTDDGSERGAIHQYKLSTPFLVPTATFVATFLTTDEDKNNEDVSFSTDGLKMFVLGNVEERVYQYNLTSAYNIATATYEGLDKSFKIITSDITPTGLEFSTDGLKMFVADYNNDRIFQFTLTSAFEVSTATDEKTITLKSLINSSEATDQGGSDLKFTADGKTMFVVDFRVNDVFQFDLATAWEIETASYSGKFFSRNNQESSPTGLEFSTDGTKMYLIDAEENLVFSHTLTTAFDITTTLYDGPFKVTQDNYPRSITFSIDGKTMIVFGDTSNTVYQHTITIPFVVSNATATSVKFLSVNDQVGDPVDVTFSADGTKMYVLNKENSIGIVYQYNLPTPFELTNVVYSGNSFTTSESKEAVGLVISLDGTKMYVSMIDDDVIYQYTLPTTPFELTNVVYSGKSINVSDQGGSPRSITFSEDGTKMLVLNVDKSDNEDKIFQYKLSSAFDISTASYDNSFSINAQETESLGLAFNADGTKLYLIGSDNKNIHPYTLAATFDLFVSSTTSPSSTTGGGSDNEHKTRPTFGIDYKTGRLLVEGGFSFNGVSHDITDNFWTPFAEQEVKVGQSNTFTIKTLAAKQLKVQEFLFGIPEVGAAHKAELGVEIHFDYYKEVQKINVVQKSDVIDVDSVSIITYDSKCTADAYDKKCTTTELTMTFLEPLQDKIMALKAIDFKNRSQVTYLNDGFDVTGKSLNPMVSAEIAGPEKYEGLLQVTQSSKYSNIWVSQDGREFQKNNYGGFIEVNKADYIRLTDDGMVKNRLHSEFADYKQAQVDRATILLLETCPGCFEKYTDFDDSFAYEFPEEVDRLESLNELLKSEANRAEVIMDSYP